MSDPGKHDWGTWVLMAASVAVVFAAVFLLRGAGLFQPGGRWLTLDELDHIGSWLGGLFAPIALAWAARAFFLQKEQQYHEILRMRDEREAERARAEAEREAEGKAEAAAFTRLDPSLSGTLTLGPGSPPQRLAIVVTNSGHTVTRVLARVDVFDERHSATDEGADFVTGMPHVHDQPLMTNEAFGFEVDLRQTPVSHHNMTVKVELLSLRIDGVVRRTVLVSRNNEPLVQVSNKYMDDVHGMNI